ncbi:hypothetical protein BGZ73_005720 [Actinomortierella ambigua]|nr:hypothetical protein BGZ73_005720 [Actinomortierella ambigua]
MKVTTVILFAAIGTLAVTTGSARAQDQACLRKCDQDFSKSIGDCILPYKNDSKNPKRIECVGKQWGSWWVCKEMCDLDF